MLETHAALRAEALARAPSDLPRATGPRLPRPRNPLKERILALLGRAPARKPRGCATC